MHDELRDLIAPVALGAASRDEAIQVEAHVRGCAQCREELNALRSTADVLALAPEEQEPSPDLRERLMSQVRAEAAARKAAEEPGGVVPHAPPAPDLSRAGDDGERSGWWRSLLRPWPATALALGAIAAALLVWNVALQVQPGEPDQVTAAAISGTEAAPGVSGRVLYVGDEDALVVRLQGLSQLPPGQAYHLWTIDDGIPKSAGVFRPDASGQAMVVAGGAAGAEAIGLTAQPADRTTAPEGPLLMTASLSAA
jgi:anti-sigma-K factor RskA